MGQRVAAIVLAAGSGKRLGSDGPKALVHVVGVPMVTRAVGSAATVADLVVVAAPPGMESQVRGVLEGSLDATSVVPGGSTRQASVRAALTSIPADRDVLVVHDAARPFATHALFESVVAAVEAGADGVIPVVAIADTVKRVRAGIVVATEDRSELALAQTPQAFRASVLREAHVKAEAAGAELTDDAAVLEWAGHQVSVIPGEPGNFKITTAADLERAGGRG